MVLIIYQLLEKRKDIFKALVIFSLLLISSITVLFVPQIANPHNLSKYFQNFKNGSISYFLGEHDIEGFPDIYLGGVSDSIEFLNSFNSAIEKSSMKNYKLFEVEEIGSIIDQDVFGNNFTLTDNSTTLYGIDANLFAKLADISVKNLDAEAYILSNDSSFFSGDYLFTDTIVNHTFTLKITDYVNQSSLNNLFPHFYRDFVEYHYLYNVYNIIFLPLTKLSSIYSSYIESWPFRSYVKFTQFQEDIMYWSIDSPRKIKSFANDIYEELSSLDPEIQINNLYNSYLQYVEDPESTLMFNFVYYVYSFLRIIQFTVWSLSIFIIIQTIAKIKKRDTNKELRIFLSGFSWKKYVLLYVIESFIVTFGSCLLVSIFIYPFIRLQTLFSTSFVFDSSITAGLIICPVILFLITLAVNIDFHFYLQRLIKNGIVSEDYQPFFKITKLKKISYIVLPILLFIWFLNQFDFFATLLEILIIVVATIVSIIIYFSMRFIIKGILKIINKRKLRKNKPLSKIFILFKLNQKDMLKKLFLYTIIIAFISSILFYSSFTAESYNANFIASNGAEIVINTHDLANNTSLDYFLGNYSEIRDYTSVLSSHYDKYSPFNNRTIIKTEINNASYLINGISNDDYFAFYESWKKRHWLSEGSIDFHNSSVIYVSEKFKSLGFTINDTLEFIDNSTLDINGFIYDWPGICNRFKTNRDLVIILPQTKLESLLLLNNKSKYNFYFYTNVHRTKINSTVNYLIPHLKNLESSFESIRTIDSLVFEGIRLVLLMPLVILFELLVILFLAQYFYQHLDELSTDPKTKTLGFIGMVSDYRKTLINYQLVESAILFSSLMIVFIINFIAAFLISTKIYGGLISLSISAIQGSTVLYVSILFILYIVLIIIQNMLQYIRYHSINLSRIYRHPE